MVWHRSHIYLNLSCWHQSDRHLCIPHNLSTTMSSPAEQRHRRATEKLPTLSPAKAPTLAELAPCFPPEACEASMPSLYTPFPYPMRESHPFAKLLNTYLGHVRLVPPNVLGPIEHPTTPGDYSKVPLYITFPLHLPSRETPWILSAYSPQTPIDCGTSVFLPFLGEGQVSEVIDLTTTTATIVVIPKASPGDAVHICVPLSRIPSRHVKPASISARGRSDLSLQATVWPRLRKAISFQL